MFNEILPDNFIKGDLEQTGGNCWCAWAKIGKYWFYGSANGGGAYYKTEESAMESWGSLSEDFVRDVTDKEELFHIHQDILNYCLKNGGDYSKSEYLFWLKDLYEYGATADEEITVTVELEPNYCPKTDTTFIMKNTYADEEKTKYISAECVGWYRGEPTEEDTIIFANRNMKDF